MISDSRDWLARFDDSTTEFPTESVLRALDDRLNRRLVFALREHDGPVRVPGAVTPRGGDPDDVERDLVSEHLPELEEAGFIEWNRATGEVSRGPNWSEIEPVLDLLAERREELPVDWL